MIDPKRIRQNPEEFVHVLEKRKVSLSVDSFLQLDEKRRQFLNEADEKKALRNALSKQIGIARKKGADEKEIAAITADMQRLSVSIESLDADVASLDAEIESFLLSLPNPPHVCVPVHESVEKRRMGEIRRFLWEPKTHREIGSDLHIAEEGSDGASPILRGFGARLERSLVNFFLDHFSNHQYEEISLHSDESILSVYRNAILSGQQLPLRHCRISSRMELFEMVMPEQSEQAWERMTGTLEQALMALKLPFRSVALRADQLEFSAAMAEQIEVWMPSLSAYVPAAMCSSHEEFLARRKGVRYRTESKEKPRFVYTMGAAVDLYAVLSAILENGQNENGSVTLPELLCSYACFQTIG